MYGANSRVLSIFTRSYLYINPVYLYPALNYKINIMTDNFDLKKFLVENKLTKNSKQLTEDYNSYDDEPGYSDRKKSPSKRWDTDDDEEDRYDDEDENDINEERDEAADSNERLDSDIVSDIKHFLNQYINLEYDKDTLLDNITNAINSDKQ